MLSKETNVAKKRITFIEEVLSLNCKKFNNYINNYKNHFIVIVEKLRSEMLDLAFYIYRAEKRLRDLIQLKIIVDYKLYRNIE